MEKNAQQDDFILDKNRSIQSLNSDIKDQNETIRGLKETTEAQQAKIDKLSDLNEELEKANQDGPDRSLDDVLLHKGQFIKELGDSVSRRDQTVKDPRKTIHHP